MNCSFCGGKISIDGRVNRSDTCPHCGRDFRCCKQCKFYEPDAYNECREVSAERIVDKERANLCEYFVVKGSAQGKPNSVQEVKKALEALFKE